MHVTVCICTRNRGDTILGALKSVLESTYQDFDIVVVDQSADGETEQAVRPILDDDARLTYFRTCSVGVCRARNICVQHARGPILAFTDDDCEVSLGWLQRLVDCFTADPAVGEICGEVRAGPYDASAGFIPDFLVQNARRVSSPWLKWRCRGIGANMAMRAEVLRQVGAFDEMLGPGSSLFMGEDYDLTYRVLKAGYPVMSVPEACVIHHGYRDWKEARTLMRRSGFGTGAAYMKHLRLGDLAILPTFVHDWIHVISFPRLVRLQRNSGAAYAFWYIRGAIGSLRYPIDKRHRVYLSTQTCASSGANSVD